MKKNIHITILMLISILSTKNQSLTAGTENIQQMESDYQYIESIKEPDVKFDESLHFISSYGKDNKFYKSIKKYIEIIPCISESYNVKNKDFCLFYKKQEELNKKVR